MPRPAQAGVFLQAVEQGFHVQRIFDDRFAQFAAIGVERLAVVGQQQLGVAAEGAQRRLQIVAGGVGEGFYVLNALAQLPVLRRQRLFEPHDALPGPQAHPQLFAVKGLGEKIVGPGLHARHHVLALGFGRQQDRVNVIGARTRPNAANQVESVHLRHHPICDDNGKGRRPGAEQPPGFSAVVRYCDIVSPLLQALLQQAARHGRIFCD